MRDLRLSSDRSSIRDQYFELLDEAPEHLCISCLFLKSTWETLCIVPSKIKLEQIRNPQLAYRPLMWLCDGCFKGMTLKIYKDLGWKVTKKR